MITKTSIRDYSHILFITNRHYLHHLRSNICVEIYSWKQTLQQSKVRPISIFCAIGFILVVLSIFCLSKRSKDRQFLNIRYPVCIVSRTKANLYSTISSESE